MKRAGIFVTVLALVSTLGTFGKAQAATAPVIQPGVSITMDNAFCTLNWIYDGRGGQAGKVFAGTARHCVSGVGDRISLADTTLGSAILAFGTVRYVSQTLDFSLIEIDAGLLSHVDPSLKGHPTIPTGVSTTGTAAVGDLIQFSGYGVGFHLTAVTQEQRVGVLGSNDGSQQFVYGAVSPGDSGGPVADITDGGKALGIVDTVGLALTPVPQVGEGGVALQGLLADAAANGFPIALRQV